MNKVFKIFVLTFLLSAGVISAITPPDQFGVSLNAGSTNQAEVLKLQKFLVSQGLLSAKPSGLYLSLTQKAVRAFQAKVGVEQTGYFGPLTRAKANSIISGNIASEPKTTQPTSVISGVSVAGSSNSLMASVLLSKDKVITWQTSNYPAGVGVNINLLRKVGTNPTSYVFVRSIAKDIANDGTETWIPLSGETGTDLYIEVTCSTTHQFKGGCYFDGKPVKAN